MNGFEMFKGVLIGVFVGCVSFYGPKLANLVISYVQYRKSVEKVKLRFYNGPADGEYETEIVPKIPEAMIKQFHFVGVWNREVHSYSSDGSEDLDGALRMYHAGKGNIYHQMSEQYEDEFDDYDEYWDEED